MRDYSDVLVQLTDSARRYPDILKVVLFGSRARGDFHKTSDFDICVYCSQGEAFTKFYFDVDEIDTFYKIDLLRYEDISNDVLKNEIAVDGVVVYERVGK